MIERLDSLHQRFIDNLQHAYNANRAPELWGTPEVSSYFFEDWRSKGLFYAVRSLIYQQEEIGNQNVSAKKKALLNLLGSVFLTTGIREFAIGENDYKANPGTIPSLKRKGAEAAWGLTLSWLFTAQGGESGVPYKRPEGLPPTIPGSPEWYDEQAEKIGRELLDKMDYEMDAARGRRTAMRDIKEIARRGFK